MKTQKSAARRRARQNGVTLIEMMVVVTIIALFIALVAPRMFGSADKARVTAARAQMSNLSTALGMYKLDTSTFPTTEQGLQALRVAPDGVPLWKGPYLPKDVPVDPWGNPYVYTYPGEHGDEPDIVSHGADGKPGGEGVNADVTSWQN
ncbi:MAG TPA: type II secretion system major pseudopilin GspG [Bryobacteraceae bacterium]|nr:type II secretion system major pseudopilin GspG [Bryobacteraceae bacterium]